MKTKIIYLLFSCIILSSCIVFHSGNITSGPLLNINDRYVDIATGSASSLNMFGFINIGGQTLLLEAKKNLFENRPLNKNEYYSNFTADISKSWILGFFLNTKVIVSAEVLRLKDSLAQPFTKDFKNVSQIATSDSYFITEKDTFYHNEIIYYSLKGQYRFRKAKIISIKGHLINLKAIHFTSLNELVNMYECSFYSASKSYAGLISGDSVEVEKNDLLNKINSSWFAKSKKGIVLGLTCEKALIRNKSGVNDYPYNKIQKIK